MTATGPGCVKTQKNSVIEKNDLVERPLRDILDKGNAHPTHENFLFLRFYTASAESKQLMKSSNPSKRKVGKNLAANSECIVVNKYKNRRDRVNKPMCYARRHKSPIWLPMVPKEITITEYRKTPDATKET